jgi:hypothetical protein
MNPDGTLADQQLVHAQSLFMPRVAVADIDGDGVLDAALSEPSVSLLFGTQPGAPVFTPGGSFAASGEPGDVAIADLDGNGVPEILLLTTESFYLLSLDSGTLSVVQSQAVAAPYYPGSLAVGDIDGDGDLDVVLTSGAGDAEVLLNTAW